MRIYHEHIYPWLVNAFGDPNPIQGVRERIVPLAEGTVLEIGVGPGVNFTHYDPTKVGRVYALEPNRGMIRLAEQGEWPQGVSPRGPRRTVREPLDSYGSHHRATPHTHLPMSKQ